MTNLKSFEFTRTCNINLKVILLALIFIFQSGYLYYLTDLYAVNILFWDQWDFYLPIFENHKFSEYFSHQHGPHRQGLGLYYTAFVNYLSGWNSRAESFSIFFLLLLSCVFALLLKYRLTHKFSIFDALIIVLFLNPAHLETIIGTPNPAHSAIPLLLILIYCHGWLFQNIFLKYSILITANHFLIFTGFGIFIGPITILLIVTDLILSFIKKNGKKEIFKQLFLLSLACLSIFLFFRKYYFDPAVDCFEIKWADISKYSTFTSLLFSRNLSFNYIPGNYREILAVRLGFLILITLILISISNYIRLLKKDKENLKHSRVIFILSAFALLYSFNISIGRLCLSLEASQAPRYATLLMTGPFVLYLSIIFLSNHILKYVILVLFSATLILGYYFSFELSKNTGTFYKNRKESWKNCYLKYEDIEKCDHLTRTQIYPNPLKTNLEQKLKYLKERKLNLYLEN